MVRDATESIPLIVDHVLRNLGGEVNIGRWNYRACKKWPSSDIPGAWRDVDAWLGVWISSNMLQASAGRRQGWSLPKKNVAASQRRGRMMEPDCTWPTKFFLCLSHKLVQTIPIHPNLQFVWSSSDGRLISADTNAFDSTFVGSLIVWVRIDLLNKRSNFPLPRRTSTLRLIIATGAARLAIWPA